MKMRILHVTPLLLVLLGCGKNTPVVADAGTAGKPLDSAVPATEAVAEPAMLRVPAGTPVRLRLAHAVDSARNRAGDRFEATLASPVSVNGHTVLPVGTRFNGHLTSSKSSGRLRGRGYLGLTLDSFELNGRTHRVATNSSVHATGNHNKRNLALIGGGSGLGALIGGLAGGGKGALIGAAAGAGAGTAGAAATGKKNVYLPAETLLRFSLKSPIEVPAGGELPAAARTRL